MNESVHTNPFVIKVRKTSSDSWLIDNRNKASKMHELVSIESEENEARKALSVSACNTSSSTDNNDTNDIQDKNLIMDETQIPEPVNGEKLTIEQKPQFNVKETGIPRPILPDTDLENSTENMKDVNLSVLPFDNDFKSKRWYSCISCAFSSLNLIGFLIHVHQTHFVDNTPDSAKSDLLLNTVNPDNATIGADVQKIDLKTHENATKNCGHPVISDQNDEKTPPNEILCKVEPMVRVEKLEDSIVTSTSAHDFQSPTINRDEPFVNISKSNVSNSETVNGDSETHQQQQKTSSVFGESIFENMSFGKKNENIIAPGGSINKSPEEALHHGSRGSKINSIVNNLKEYTANASKDFGGLTVEKNHFNDAQSTSSLNNGDVFQKLPTLVDYETNIVHPLIGSTPNTFSRNRSFTPQQNCHNSTSKYPPCNVGAGIGFPRGKQNGAGHFEDLQSLLASGCVTMPNAAVLQSIKCSQDAWNHIQETLHEAFSEFPYLTIVESQNLAEITGLTLKQVNTLFVVARLQHGISWEPHEIEGARISLTSIMTNRFQTQNQRVHKSLPIVSTDNTPPSFSHLTKDQHAILKWSFTTIPFTTNELDRLQEVTLLDKSVILQYFREIRTHLAPPRNKSSLKRERNPSQTHLNDETTIDCIRKLKKSTNKANNYFEKSRISINRGKT